MISAGQSIGSYLILRKIGTGGMGAVYLAEHPLLGKKVALKVIHRELASNKDVVQRFFQEARAVTKIGNEHIISVHDFGQTAEGDHFYIMEYLEGETLAQVLARDQVLDTFRALHIGAQMASALAAAHAAGVVHRDLKPDNIMLTLRLGDPDFVVLLDFGLAKMFVGSGEQPAIKTAAGVLLGTPQYMSPEACESRPSIDHRTDVYALGVLLFQMMTGRLPFDGETMGEVLVKQVTQLPPPLRGFNPSIPPSVEQIVLRCLAKNVDARFPTMTALREALLDPETYLMKQPPVAPARSLAPGEMKVDGKMVIAYAAAEKAALARTASHTGPLVPKIDEHMRALLNDGSLAAPRGMGPSPEIVVPSMPKMNTMRIATPLGYSSRPPRKVWPIMLVVSLLLGLGGGAFAVAWFGRSTGTPAEPGQGRDRGRVESSGGSGTGSGMASAAGPSATPPMPVVQPSTSAIAPPKPDAVDAASSPPTEPATIVIDSTPPGAEVIGSEKKSHGRTPATLALPISDTPIVLELRLAGYQRKVRRLVVTGNTTIHLTLAKATPGPGKAGGPKGTGTGKNRRRGTGDLDLMRPE